jgi:hypothetical protein
MQNVAIFGVPRSGTSWLGQIFNSSPNVIYRYQPIFAYSFEDTLSANSSSKDIRVFHKNLLATDDDFVCQKKNISGNDAPQFSKGKTTHLVWKEVRYLNIIKNLLHESPTKVIGIIRHPCGVLKSWMKAPKEFDSDWDIKEEWRHAQNKNKNRYDYYGYERWKEAAEMFIELERQYPTQFKSVVYESLLDETYRAVEELFDFTELNLSLQAEDFLGKSSGTESDDPYSVYRNDKQGDKWRSELPQEIINEVLDDTDFRKIAKHYEFGK